MSNTMRLLSYKKEWTLLIRLLKAHKGSFGLSVAKAAVFAVLVMFSV